MIQECQDYLLPLMSLERLGMLHRELSLSQGSSEPTGVAEAYKPSTPAAPRVFLAFPFSEEGHSNALKAVLELAGFTVSTGEHLADYIHSAIIELIRSCDFFVCLFTRNHSQWLFEEKGAAFMAGKKGVLLIEEGVVHQGALAGDWQRIVFTPSDFTRAACQAVDQLKSLAGARREG